MNVYNWISDNYIEIFGAVTGIIYVFLEIRQNLWLWPVGIITSAVYIWVFFTGKLYADMSLQVYYLVISILGWYWWIKGPGFRNPGPENVSSREEDMENLPSTADNKPLRVTRITMKKGIILLIVFIALYTLLWIILDRLTDSPVPEWDSFITSLSIVATWMLARKIYEHWFLWIIVNIAAAMLFFTRGLYATVVLYIVYCVMSFVGLYEWKKSMR
jgi:nicotinamide mononucleotide transporter